MQTWNISSWALEQHKDGQRFCVFVPVSRLALCNLIQLFTLFSLNLAKEGRFPLGGYASTVTQAGVSPSMGPTSPYGVESSWVCENQPQGQMLPASASSCESGWDAAVTEGPKKRWSQLHPSLTCGTHTAAVGLNLSQAPSAKAQDQWRPEASQPPWYDVGAELPC